MKCKISVFMFLFVCIVSENVYSQSEAGALFLLISPSPKANATGTVYLPGEADDPFAQLYNPANLGLLAQRNFFAMGIYAEKTSFLPNLASNSNFNSNAFCLGYNFQNVNKKIPITIGLGFHEVKRDYGEQQFTSETGPEVIGSFSRKDQSNNWTLSFSIDFYIQGSIGWTFKNIESDITPSAKTTVKAQDFGLVLKFPVIDSYFRYMQIRKPQFSPFFTPMFWYSKNNSSDDKLIYIDAAQADPLPRVARLGTGITAGVTFLDRKIQQWNLFSIEWGNQAEDMLVNRFPDGRWEYKSGVGDISFFKNLVLGKSNMDVYKMKGWQFNLFDLFYIRNGSYEDHIGKVMFKTEGLGIRAAGFLKMLTYFDFSLGDNNLIQFLMDHVDVQYNQSEWDVGVGHPVDGIKYRGISLLLK